MHASQFQNSTHHQDLPHSNRAATSSKPITRESIIESIIQPGSLGRSEDGPKINEWNSRKSRFHLDSNINIVFNGSNLLRNEPDSRQLLDSLLASYLTRLQLAGWYWTPPPLWACSRRTVYSNLMESDDSIRYILADYSSSTELFQSSREDFADRNLDMRFILVIRWNRLWEASTLHYILWFYLYQAYLYFTIIVLGSRLHLQVVSIKFRLPYYHIINHRLQRTWN